MLAQNTQSVDTMGGPREVARQRCQATNNFKLALERKLLDRSRDNEADRPEKYFGRRSQQKHLSLIPRHVVLPIAIFMVIEECPAVRHAQNQSFPCREQVC